MAVDGELIFNTRIDNTEFNRNLNEVTEKAEETGEKVTKSAAKTSDQIKDQTAEAANGISQQIQAILEDTSRSTRSKVASIASIYKKDGMGSSEAMCEAWRQVGTAAQKVSEQAEAATENMRNGCEGVDESMDGIVSGLSSIGGKFSAVAGIATASLSAIVATAKYVANQITKIIDRVRKGAETVAKVIGFGLKQVGQSTFNNFFGDILNNQAFGELIALLQSELSLSALISKANESITLGSDLAEVQNVVDTTFTSMSDSVNNWAKNAKSSYGLSETMAKKYVGLFGAMSSAFGFTEKEAYSMSTTLAGLAGDVASFFNTSQDEAYTKLKSVFSGETETLKDLGIVMTQNALDAYALASGYNKTTSAMTEQEKVALRYNFVLDQLKTASGDFVRTQNAWANQIRILQLRWQSFMATVGDGLINILTPCVKILNTLLDKLETVANWFNQIIKGIFGNSNITTSAITEDLAIASDETADLANSADEAAKALEDVADSTNEIYGNLASYDKLNVLGQESSLQNASVADAVEDAMVQSSVIPAIIADAVDEAKKEIVEYSDFVNDIIAAVKKDDWYKVGYVIGNELSKALANIPWKKVKETVKHIAENIGNAINGFVEGIDWEVVGETIAECLNTAIEFLNTLLETIDWWKIGESLAEAFNSFLETFDAREWGRLIANKINAMFKLLGGFVNKIEWGELGRSIGESLLWYFKTLNLTQRPLQDSIPQIIADFINSLVQAGIELFTFTDPETGKSMWATIGTKIGKGLQEFIDRIEIEDIFTFIKSGTEALVTLIYNAVKELHTFELGTELAEGFNDWFSDEEWWRKIGEMLNVILTKIMGLVVGFFTTFDRSTLADALTSLLDGLGIEDLAAKAVLGFIGVTQKETEGNAGFFVKIGDYIKGKIFENFTESAVGKYFQNVWKGIKNAFDGVGDWFKNTFGDAWQAVQDIFSGKIGISDIATSVSNTFKDLLNKLIDGINNLVTTPFNQLNNTLDSLRDWEFAGQKFFSWIPKITAPQIPKLATGTVVPANYGEFAAILGDNKREPEIVSPVSAMKQAMREVMAEANMSTDSNSDIHITLKVGDETLTKVVVRASEIYKKRHGGRCIFA